MIGGRPRLVATAPGVRLCVRQLRTRRPEGRILFVPGFLSFVESWELVLGELTTRFDVDYLESREKRSSVIDRRARFRIEDLAADLAGATTDLGLRPGTFDVVASCSGAAGVLRAYADGGLRPRRMVWVAPTLRPVVPWIVVPLSVVLRGPLYGLLLRVAVAWYRRFLNPPGRDAFQHSRFMAVVAGADPYKATRGARDLYARRVDAALAREVDVPVLVLAASRDASHPFAAIRRLTELLPDGRLVDLGTFWRTRSPAAGRAMARFLHADAPAAARGQVAVAPAQGDTRS
jgi:pimeloyl-ACP methyl ester carboxylesterase